MANTTEFVTAIIHRWNPGSYTMELLLGGVEADYKIPSTRPVAAAKAAVDALVNTPGAVEEMEFKFPTVFGTPITAAPQATTHMGSKIPFFGLETTSQKEIREAGEARWREISGESSKPNWVKEADKTSVEREEVDITRVETVKRIVKLTSSLLWRR